jgi:hypothetical protein
MIGHDSCSMKRDCDGVVVQAMLQYDSSGFWGASEVCGCGM